MNLDYFDPEDWPTYRVEKATQRVYNRVTGKTVNPRLKGGVPYLRLLGPRGKSSEFDAREIFGAGYLPRLKSPYKNFDRAAFEPRYKFDKHTVTTKAGRVLHPRLRNNSWYFDLTRNDGKRVAMPADAVYGSTMWVGGKWWCIDFPEVSISWDQFPDYEFARGRVWRVASTRAITTPEEIKPNHIGTYKLTDFAGATRRVTNKQLNDYIGQ